MSARGFSERDANRIGRSVLKTERDAGGPLPGAQGATPRPQKLQRVKLEEELHQYNSVVGVKQIQKAELVDGEDSWIDTTTKIPNIRLGHPLQSTLPAESVVWVYSAQGYWYVFNDSNQVIHLAKKTSDIAKGSTGEMTLYFRNESGVPTISSPARTVDPVYAEIIAYPANALAYIAVVDNEWCILAVEQPPDSDCPGIPGVDVDDLDSSTTPDYVLGYEDGCLVKIPVSSCE